MKKYLVWSFSVCFICTIFVLLGIEMSAKRSIEFFLLVIGEIGIGFCVFFVGCLTPPRHPDAKPLSFKVGLGMILGGILVWIATGSIEGHQYQKTLEEGDRILDALAQYHHKMGKYPESLHELIPTHFSAIPHSRMRWGREVFHYQLIDGQAYVAFTYRNSAECYDRLGDEEPWRCENAD
jgi:hypothetical protein